MKNEEPDLIIDSDFSPPKPLDPHIASVSLSTSSNYFNDGYEVSLSANFGSERVKLVGDGFEIDTKVSIKKSEIQLRLVNSTLLPLHSENDTSIEREITETQILDANKKSQHSSSLGVGVSTELTENFGNKFDANYRYSHENAVDAQHLIKSNRHGKNWRRIGSNLLAIGGNGIFLNGPEIENYRGWKVFPVNIDTPSGIVALLKVREDWIDFDDIKIKHSENNLGKMIGEFLRFGDKKSNNYFQYC